MSSSTNKQSVRSKINSFFDNGSSAQKSIKQSRDIEDPDDIYNHTKEFFKKNVGLGDDDGENSKVEVGERRIKGDIDMNNDFDDLVYKGKKISRKDLEKDDNDSDGDEIILNGQDEEDEEIDSDAYGSESKDDQMPSDSSDQNEDDVNEEEEVQSLDERQAKVLTKAQNAAKQQNALDGDDEDLDMALQQLKKEEKEESKYIEKRVSSDIQKANSVKTQKKIFDQFLHQRILMQKLLQHANKLPTADLLDLFIKNSRPMQMNLLSCKRNLKKHVKDLVKLQKQLFVISETSINLNTLNEKQEDTPTQEMFQVIDKNFQSVLPFVEETVERWNSRTMLIKNLQGNQNSKSKAFGKTILQQVHSILNDDHSKGKLFEKSQLKRDSYKVLGRSVDDLTQERDTNIFNDFDFYQILLKDFLASNDSGEGAGTNGHEDNDIYLDGADLSLTQKYLERKKKLQQGQQKIKKEVDRKASKNRKIRYVVHEKIVNFMTPQDNFSTVYEGKDSILRSLFGQKPADAIIQDTQNDKETSSKKKSNKKAANIRQDDMDDDIKLL